MSKSTVFVSGATGFIAQHIIKQLLDSEKYKVVGSVRNSSKADSLKSNFNNNPDLSLVYVTDIAKEDAFDEVFQEHGSKFDYIIHTASPFFFATNDFEKDLIIPAKNGTSGIFHATVKYGVNVKKFVITSSYAAVCSVKQDSDNKNTFDESSWNNLTKEESLANPVDAYCYSKTIAEQTAWELQKTLKPKFTLTAINPTFVFGPQCFDSSVSGTLNTSCEFINTAVHSKLGDEVPPFNGAYIDVRDVAKAHIDSLTNEKLAGKRLILSEDRFTIQSLYDVINKEFSELQGKIAKGVPGSDVAAIKELATLDNHVTKELLGFPLRGLTETVCDTVLQILKME